MNSAFECAELVLTAIAYSRAPGTSTRVFLIIEFVGLNLRNLSWSGLFKMLLAIVRSVWPERRYSDYLDQRRFIPLTQSTLFLYYLV